MSDFIEREVNSKLTQITRDREVVETESAIRIFERSWGWAKLIIGAAGSLAAILVAAGIWQYVDLHTTVKTAESAVQSARVLAENSIGSTAAATSTNLKTAGAKSLEQIQTTAAAATKSSDSAQRVAKAEASAIEKRSNALKSDMAKQGSDVSRDIASARQQIQAASKLQPEMADLQNQLKAAQIQIQDQQKVITSSADFAKKIFSSHRQLLFDIKKLDAAASVTVAVGKNSEGIDLVVLYLLLPETPVNETLQVQFNQTSSSPGSTFAIDNILVCFIQKPALEELTAKPISVSYFPDPSGSLRFSALTEKDGDAYADGNRLPYGRSNPISQKDPSKPKP